MSITRRRWLASTAACAAVGVLPRLSRADTTSPSPADDLALVTDYSRRVKSLLYKRPTGILRFPYLTAGVKSYPYVVDWDAIWGGMSYAADGDPEPLRNSLLDLLDHVAPNGKGQRVIRPDGYGAATFHSRPFLATGAFVAARELNSVQWLAGHWFARLRATLLYWHSHRTGRHGLAKWWHVDEGFADNGLGNWAWDTNAVEGVDLNAQLILEHAAAAWIATRLGLKTEAAEHQQLAANLHLRLEHSLWDEKEGFYFSSFNPRERGAPCAAIRVLHYTNLWPLWLGLASPERARRALKYVCDPEHFWSPYGIRSMAKSDARYNNARNGMTLPMIYPEPSGAANRSSNWQGPIWSLTNYQAALALARYGLATEAQTVCERILRVHANVLRSKGVFYENYDAETGAPLAAEGGIGSWCLMLRHLPAHLAAQPTWILQGLELPASSG